MQILQRRSVVKTKTQITLEHAEKHDIPVMDLSKDLGITMYKVIYSEPILGIKSAVHPTFIQALYGAQQMIEIFQIQCHIVPVKL